jgi:hypothetical protein
MAHTNPIPTETEPSTIRIPPSYLYALGNRLTSQQVDAFLDSPLRPSFFYGSLMFPKVISGVTHIADVDSIIKNMTPATLPGYRRFAIKWAEFPAVLPSDEPDDAVYGVLMFGLTETEKDRLLAYESGLYNVEATTVEIELIDQTNRMLTADVYVWNGPRDDLVVGMVWSVEKFLQGHSHNDRFQ